MRIVAHIDMDAFFAACEERYNPHFRGKPIVVCTSTTLSVDPSSYKVELKEIGGLEILRGANHPELVEGSSADPKGGRGRGVVSTANYAARKYGIRSAMPISQAWRLAEAARMKGEPATIFLTGNFRLYSEVSERIMKILAENADAFEQASVDEAYLEWKFQNTNSPASPRLGRGRAKSQTDPWLAAETRAMEIKREILEQEGLTCSIGIGPNKLVAKIASDFKKPDGLTVVRSDKVKEFLAPLPVRVIPGIGPKTEAALNQRGIKIVRDLQKLYEVEPHKLEEWFGKWGSDLAEKARGISESPVSDEWTLKSIGEQETFEKDTLQPAFILERARVLTAQVFERFRREGFKSFQTVVVTVRFADFVTKTRSHTAKTPLSTLDALNGEALRLLLPFLDRRENPGKKLIRLIGVRVEKLS